MSVDNRCPRCDGTAIQMDIMDRTVIDICWDCGYPLGDDEDYYAEYVVGMSIN